MKRYKYVIWFMVIGVTVGLIVRQARTSIKPLSSIQTNQPHVSTPFPFQELTIPYLRARKYGSQLSELQEINKTNQYTSYVTSYTSDGLKINGLLTIPREGDKHPAIIFVHGYIPPTLYQTQAKYVAYVDYLARNGFVVFKIDLRGHGTSEGEPSGAYYASDYVIDTLNAYAALGNADFVDATKIGLWGHSMAGNVVLRSLATMPTIPAVVIWAGAGFTYQDLRDYGLSDASYRPPQTDTNRLNRRRELFTANGEFDPGNAFWRQVVPTNYLSDGSGAIELHHAVDDNVVSVEYSRNLTKILDTTSIPHQLFEYPSGGHNIADPSFSKAMQRTVDFFQKHLN